jgi:hypothetical protein
VPAGDFGVGEEPLFVPRGDLAPVGDDVEAVVRAVRRREPVAAPDDGPQAEIAGQARRRVQLACSASRPLTARPISTSSLRSLAVVSSFETSERPRHCG